jgi:hypothetical protein
VISTKYPPSDSSTKYIYKNRKEREKENTAAIQEEKREVRIQYHATCQEIDIAKDIRHPNTTYFSHWFSSCVYQSTIPPPKNKKLS